MTISRTDVLAAAERIAGRVRRTPTLTVEAGGLADYPVHLKLEHLQHTGSFKARGAYNRLLAAAEAGSLTDAGVVTASGGNAGLAVAHAGSHLGVPVEVFVPTTAPAAKVDRLRRLGADVRLVGSEYAEAHAAALLRHQKTGAVYCHAYDQPEVAAGQGTLALELLEDVPDLDTIVVAVGGGGLVAGIAAAVEGGQGGGGVRVVGVEPDTIPTLHSAFAAGKPVDVAVSGVAADSLGARRLGDVAFAVVSRVGVRSVLVPDAALAEARRALWDSCRIVAELGTAAALAALRTGAYRPEPGERVAVIVCGANTDPGAVSA